jgi:hypothetical protein
MAGEPSLAETCLVPSSASPWGSCLDASHQARGVAVTEIAEDPGGEEVTRTVALYLFCT